MKAVLHIIWCLVLPIYKIYLRLLKKVKFDFHAYISYNTKFEGQNYIGQGSRVIASELGYASYISRNGYLYNTKVGKYTCIGPDVSVVCGKHPIGKFVSIHPLFFSKKSAIGLSYVNEQLFDEYNYADEKNGFSVVIGNDVWIGENAKIMEGVIVGDGAVIAAGAVVLHDVEPYAIVAGVPAQVKKWRFNPETIQFLMHQKWWEQSNEWIRTHAHEFNDVDVFQIKYSKGFK